MFLMSDNILYESFQFEMGKFIFFSSFQSLVHCQYSSKSTSRYLNVISTFKTIFCHNVTLKGAEETSVEIATEMKKCFRLKDMLNFNVARNF